MSVTERTYEFPDSPEKREEWLRKFEATVIPQRTPKGPGQLCRLVMCNYVLPSSACGTVTIVLFDTLFINSDGTQFETGTQRVTLNYPQCTVITNNDPNACVVEIKHVAAYIQQGQLRVTPEAILTPAAGVNCFNDLPEIPLYLSCPTIDRARWLLAAEGLPFTVKMIG